MRAGIFLGAGEPLVVEDVTPLPPGPNDVVVQIDASGVCHTEAAVLSGDLPMHAPMILGHEVTGIVVDAGAAVTRAKVGDRVISSGLPACMNCAPPKGRPPVNIWTKIMPLAKATKPATAALTMRWGLGWEPSAGLIHRHRASRMVRILKNV